ncbi:unannotated protein [freshwater metagenome]|uniref:Unannotated protein n=1 Tax=freshwater metagenome TaxID=449393 RepID=A0A6J6FLG6_9ZZZZ
MRNTQLPFDVASLPLFVDEEANDCGAVFGGQLHDAIESASFRFAIFEVGGVEDRTTTQPSKTCFHDLGFGGIENEGNAGLRRKQFCKFIHVVGAISADIVDADIEYVCAFANLVLRHLHTCVEISIEQSFTELLRTVCIRAFADDHERGVLFERHERVDRSCARLMHR